MPSSIVLTVRWLGILPGAAAAAFMVALIARLVAFDPNGGGAIGTYLVQGAGSGAAFVYGGSVIAPKWQGFVGISLATIVVLGAVAAGYIASIDHRWADLLGYAATAAGASAVAAVNLRTPRNANEHG